MATKTIEVCDVFGCASKTLESYYVRAYKWVVDPTLDGGGKWVERKTFPQRVLCDRAYKRLEKKVEDGLSPPPKRSSQEESQTEETSKDE